MSQASLAKEIGVSRGVIFNLENKDWAKQPVVIEAICTRLNVNKEWLLDGVGPMIQDTRRSLLLDELAQECAGLTEAQQRFLLDTIKSMKQHNVLG